MSPVLDASALLAYLDDETGADSVREALNEGTASISAVNLAEALTVRGRRGEDAEAAAAGLTRRGVLGGLVEVLPLGEREAVAVAALEPMTRGAGLSPGDRACLAMGKLLDEPVLTADRSWAGLDVGVEIRVIR